MSTSAGEKPGPFRCSTASAVRAEPMFATASRVDRWLLVEQPGPWGPQSVPGGRMTPEALQRVTRLAREFRARLLLVRRPPKAEPRPGRSVFLAESRPGVEWTRRITVPDEAGLATLPSPEDASWSFESGPLYLVCTHGRHDPCCALLGRPVAAALAAREPGVTWECSHVGGDRFGANVVVLPHGLYLGRVGPGRVDDLVECIEAGRIPLDLLRGRSSLNLAVQAAQHFARDVVGIEGPADRFDDLLPQSEERVTDESWRVLLRGPVGPLAVTVRRVVGPTPYQLTCHAVEPKRFPGYELVGVDVPASS